MRRLEQLSLVANRVRAGAIKGDRRSTKRGSSQEFADYRDYSRGDDLRRLDWNVYARLERPFIKLFEEEEDLAVHLIVDGSASMRWPESDDLEKHAYALRLVAALGTIALSGGDQLTALLLEAGEDRIWGPFRGGHHALRLFEFLGSARCDGVTDLNGPLSRYASRGRRPGLAVLVSDLLAPDGYQGGVGTLLNRGFEVALIHLLSPDEIDPPLAGDVRLVDVETGAEEELTLDAGTAGHYRRRLADWQGEIATYCRAREVHYVPVVTSHPWDRLVLQTLRAGALLK